MISDEESFIKRIITCHKGNDGACLDLGAHRGMYTEILCDKFTTYYGFEPDKNNYNHLQKTYRYPNTTFLNKCIHTYSGETKYFITENSAFNSILPIHEKYVEVETITIDEFCADKKISFIKCDIQGAEEFVFESAIHTLTHNQLDMCLEIHNNVNHKKLFAFLQSLGYTVYDKKFNAIFVEDIADNLYKFDSVFATNRNKELHEIINFGSKQISCNSHKIINHYWVNNPSDAATRNNIIVKQRFLPVDKIVDIENSLQSQLSELTSSTIIHPTHKRVQNKGSGVNCASLPHKDDILDELYYINVENFRFNLSHVAMKYIEYSTSDFFMWHPDGPLAYQNNTNYHVSKTFLQRKITAILSLSDSSEYVGGELCIVDPCYEPMSHQYKINKGDLICFPSFCSHSVNTIVEGKRKSLVMWLSGEPLK